MFNSEGSEDIRSKESFFSLLYAVPVDDGAIFPISCLTRIPLGFDLVFYQRVHASPSMLRLQTPGLMTPVEVYRFRYQMVANTPCTQHTRSLFGTSVYEAN